MVAVAAAESSLVRSEGRVITRESIQQLAGEVNRRGRGRMAAKDGKDRRAPVCAFKVVAEKLAADVEQLAC